MMGLGSLGNGGSSSSFSNLSPLAPPFTVDRSNSKPGSTQLLNFSDSSYTGTVPFGQSWQYAADPSPATGYNFFPKHEVVTDPVPTTCMPLSSEFPPSDSVKPTSNLWSTSNPTAANTSTDTYSFGGEGYYAPYDTTPVPAFNEPPFDVSPNSGNIPVNASSHVDYTQSLSGLEYPVSHWSVWTKVADGKQDERKGINAGASFGYTNCISQGNSLEGVNIAGKDSGALSGNFTDGVYTGPSSMGHMDAKSYLAQESVYQSFNSKTAMGSILPVSCQEGLSLGSSKNYPNYENPFTPHEKFFQPLDSCPHDSSSTSKSSPVVVIRPAPSGSRIFAQKTGKTGANNSEKSDVCDLLNKGEETRLPIDSPVKGVSLGTSQSLDFGLMKDIFYASSSINNQCSSHPCGSNSTEIAVKESYASLAPYSCAPPVTFTEKCSDALDLHNPNEDSPCWKGAPAFRISLCDSVEAPSPCHFKSKLEYSDFGQSNALFPPAVHSGGTSLKKLGEDNLHNHNLCAGTGRSVPSEGTGTNNYVAEEHRTNDVMKETFEHLDLSSSSKVIKFSEDLNKHSKRYNLPQYSGNDCSSVNEHKYGPKKHSLTDGFMHSGLNLNDALEGGVVALDAAENVLRSPASQEDAKQAQPSEMGSSPKLDTQTIVHAIHNLSELLKSQCLTNACLLEEQDHDTLKHAITNLGACTAKKIETKETMFSQHDTFEKFGSRGSYMGTGTGHPQFMEEVTWDSYGLGNQPMHEDKSKNNGKQAENPPLLTPFANELGDSNEEQVVQAIKKVLNENFLSDEGLQPQALLFKNLWLEAEAKLCSLSYRARFDRMKIEMEKHKLSQGKDLNLNSSSVAPGAENDLASKTATQSASTSSESVHIDDSVMERFNILNRREEELSSSLMKEENNSVKVASEAEDSVTMRLDILRQQGNNFSSSFMEERKASAMVASDVEDSVMERFNILIQREDNLKSSFMEEKKDQDMVANDAEDPVMARLNVLRQRGGSSISSFMVEKTDPDMVANDAKDSVMARFNVLTHREEVKKDLDTVAAGSAGMGNEDHSANVVIEPYFYYHCVNAGEGKFGSCSDSSGYDSMKQFLLSVPEDPVVHSNRKARLGSLHSSGLYDNSSSDWEHVAKDEYV